LRPPAASISARTLPDGGNGAGIDVARLESLRRKGLAVSGKLGFTVTGSGTLDDPRF